MTDEEKVVSLENNIRQAIEDYKRHTAYDAVLYRMSDDFVHRLAKDSVEEKRDLRELFRLSPVWDEELDTLVINGTRTSDPDPSEIYRLASEILNPVTTADNFYKISRVKDFFAHKVEDPSIIAVINELAPRAYAPGKKKSRIFKALCKALGIADETPGSYFQRKFAMIADEMNAKKINFRLFVSLNPAHFLTMSNPKFDDRGSTLTSCHSLNSLEYSYNNGCSGYARDSVSFIVFTASDPSNPETLNNRKTTRQVFMYKPGNGVLLQSRLYNTSGGTRGAQTESKVYRDLIQREISDLEDMPNLWKTKKYRSEENSIILLASEDFGGYPDWPHEEFNAMISVRNDRADCYETFEIGAYGLCLACGCKTNHKAVCEDCDESDTCDRCGNSCNETYEVIEINGNEQYVCGSCLEDYYARCEECGRTYESCEMREVDGRDLCESCREEYCSCCEECGDEYYTTDLISAFDRSGNDGLICRACEENYYHRCERCGDLCHVDYLDTQHVCECCVADTEETNYDHA